jgi:preprotein translocase subunit SecD
MVRRLVTSLVVTVGGVAILLGANVAVGNTPALGLDLQGGASVTLQPAEEADPAALEVAVDIIRERVDSIGVAEPEILVQGDTVVINLPGISDQQRALDVIGRQGELLLRPVLQSGGAPTEGPATTVDPTATTLEGSDATQPPADAPTTTGVATGEGGGAQPVGPSDTEVLTDDAGTTYVVGPAAMSGSVFENDAVAEVNGGSWSVSVSLRSGAGGEDLWNGLTTKCFNRDAECPTGQIAMVLDGVVISAPVVQAAVFTGGTVQITGEFTETEARDLARILEFGAVPVKFEVASVQSVSPTLGTDSLRAALFAGGLGVLLVLCFFLLYYRLLTLVVVFGLVVSGSLLWSVISLLSRSNGLALTLAGAAGIIVSVGVTVDSYVVFFERLKDEIQGGRTMRGAAVRSFNSAFRTILVADAVSFLGALVLWWLTVGAVRGFAFFLGLSTMLDVLIAWGFTRPAVLLLSRTKRFGGRRVLGVATGEA